jgi:predicted MFS family arabinose efflux permease
MEQTTQQTIQKPSLPIKTKIAIWLLIVISVLVFIGTIMIYFITDSSRGAYLLSLPFIVLLILISLLSSFRKKLVWWCIVVLLILISLKPIWNLIFTLIPLILLFQDRKNFWKIAS